MTNARARLAGLATLLLVLLLGACDNRIEVSPAAPPVDRPPQLRLSLVDLWEPVPGRESPRVFRYGPAPDVELWVQVAHPDAELDPLRSADLEGFAAGLEQAAGVDIGRRDTRAGDALFSFSSTLEDRGRELFTHNWVLLHQEGRKRARADLSLRLPALWAEQPATGQLVRQLDELLFVATFD